MDNSKKAAGIFGQYQNADVLYFTSDGQAFFENNSAKNHAATLTDKSIDVQTRDNIKVDKKSLAKSAADKATAQAIAAKAQADADAKKKAADEAAAQAQAQADAAKAAAAAAEAEEAARQKAADAAKAAADAAEQAAQQAQAGAPEAAPTV